MLLARQGLLRRERTEPLAMVARLGGMNGQYATGPYLGLLARVEGFARDQLTEAVRRASLVRVTLHRSTIHLTTAADYARWYSAIRPVLIRAFRGYFPAEARSLQLEAVASAARGLLAERPLSRAELDRALTPMFPGVSTGSLAFAARAILPLVQVPDAALWDARGEVRYVLAEQAKVHVLSDEDEGRLDLARRYLTAFGPATSEDFQAWSGVTGARQLFDRLDLATFRDDQGRTLYDLPGCPQVDESVSAPVRLLPDYDNLIFGHRDRSRVLPDRYRKTVVSIGRRMPGIVLLDGMVAGTWRRIDRGEAVDFEIALFEEAPKSIGEELRCEAEGLLAHLANEALAGRVVIERASGC